MGTQLNMDQIHKFTDMNSTLFYEEKDESLSLIRSVEENLNNELGFMLDAKKVTKLRKKMVKLCMLPLLQKIQSVRYLEDDQKLKMISLKYLTILHHKSSQDTQHYNVKKLTLKLGKPIKI